MNPGPVNDPPVDPRDELASSLLDGEAAPEGRADDPEVKARVERFRSIRSAIATSPPAPREADREEAVGAALAAFHTKPEHDTATGDGAAAEDGTKPGGDTATGLAPLRPGGRRAMTDRRWLAAAAAVVALLVSVPLLLARDADDPADDRLAAGEPDASARILTGDAEVDVQMGEGDVGAEHATPDDVGAAQGATGLEESPPLATGIPVPLGDHSELDQLLDTTRRVLDGHPPPERKAAPGDVPPACEDRVATLPGPVELLGVATLGDADLVVAVISRDAVPTAVLLSARDPACPVLSEHALGDADP
jgi:hypothetical protein